MAKVGSFKKWEMNAKHKSAPKWTPDKEPTPRPAALAKAQKRAEEKELAQLGREVVRQRHKARRFYEQEAALWK